MAEKEEKRFSGVTKLFWKGQYAIGLISAIIIVALGSLIIAYSIFQPITGSLLTFWTSFLVGMVGAGVYLLLLLMTESKLKILENHIVGDLPLMTLLYIMSGGFVAAITQTSTGILSSNGLQAVFMIGFGWQGALSGVGASGSIRKATEDYSIDSEKNKKDIDTVTSSLERTLEEARKELKVAKEHILEMEMREGG